MAKPQISERLSEHRISAQTSFRSERQPIQAYGTVNYILPWNLKEPVRLEDNCPTEPGSCDTMTLA